MEYTPEQLKKVVKLGMLGYGHEKCFNVLELDESLRDQFKNDFTTSTSPIYTSYKKGQDLADFAIDSKLFSLAKEGDLNALDALNERKIKRELDYEDDFIEKNA